MGRYVAADCPEADAAVSSILGALREGLRSILDWRLSGVILVGSYGRGEGGAFLRDGRARLVNDLDVLAFAEGVRADARDAVAQLTHQLLEIGCGLKEVHVELVSKRRFQFLVPRTVAYYEMCAGHCVIDGDPSLSRLMRPIDPRRLPIYEGANYLKNRGAGLLIAGLSVMTGGQHGEAVRINTAVEIDKAAQAMGDACLLLARRYHFSYRERLVRFRALDLGQIGLPPQLHRPVGDLYARGMEAKLWPRFESRGWDKLAGEWRITTDVFEEFFRWFEGRRFGRSFENWNDYAETVRRDGAGETFVQRVRGGTKALAQAVRKGGPGVSAFRRTRESLSTLPLTLFSFGSNDKAEAARAYLRRYYPDSAASRILNIY